jgi:hypothetical protein
MVGPSDESISGICNDADDNINNRRHQSYTAMLENHPISPLSDEDGEIGGGVNRSKYGPPSSTYADVDSYDPTVPSIDAFSNKQYMPPLLSKDHYHHRQHQQHSSFQNADFPYPPRSSSSSSSSYYHHQQPSQQRQQHRSRHRPNNQYNEGNNKRTSFTNYSSYRNDNARKQNNERRHRDAQHSSTPVSINVDIDRVDVSRFLATYFQGPIQTVDVERPFQYLGTQSVTHSTRATIDKTLVFTTRLMIELFFDRANTLRDISIEFPDNDDVKTFIRKTTAPESRLKLLHTVLSVRTVSSRHVLWNDAAETDITALTEKLGRTFDFTNPIPLFAFDDSLEIVWEFHFTQSIITTTRTTATTTDCDNDVNDTDLLLQLIKDNPPSVNYTLTAYGTMPSTNLIENTSVRVHSVPSDFYCKCGKLT